MAWDSQHNIYGTTTLGGANGYGTVFKLDSSGNFTILYSFTGGSAAAPGGYGTLFVISPATT